MKNFSFTFCTLLSVMLFLWPADMQSRCVSQSLQNHRFKEKQPQKQQHKDMYVGLRKLCIICAKLFVCIINIFFRTRCYLPTYFFIWYTLCYKKCYNNISNKFLSKQTLSWRFLTKCPPLFVFTQNCNLFFNHVYYLVIGYLFKRQE